MDTVLERKPIECDGGAVIDKAVKLGSGELRRKAKGMASSFAYWHGSQPEGTLDKLKKTLVSLQIEPYTAESVQAYKAHIDRKIWWKNLLPRVIEKAILAIGGLAAVGFGAWCILGPFLLLLYTLPAWTAWIPLASIPLLFATMALNSLAERLKIYDVHWRRALLANYMLQQVPDFAVQTAVDVKERCPEANIFIEECRINEYPVDPFLVAVVKEEKFYLEVWNEEGAKEILKI